MVVLPVNAQGQFVGSKTSDVYHYPSCSHAKNIKAENQIWFVDAQDAVNHGYRPCSVCNPPLPASSSPSPSPSQSPSPSSSQSPEPTPTPSQEPTSTPEQQQIASFPTTLVAATSVAIVAVVGAGLLVYFRKRHH